MTNHLWKNRIHQTSSVDMSAVPDESVHLVVTSPPYNVGVAYENHEDHMPLHIYLKFLREVWQELYRVLMPFGRVCINVANVDRGPYRPMNCFVTEDMTRLGFLMRGEVIWNKGAGAGVSTAWGSWRSASNPVLRDTHEYILVFSKGGYGREKGESTIESEEFTAWTKSVWEFPPESAKRVGHPAPFPPELPRRCIRLYSYVGDTVLDPFLGSGTTAVVAQQEGRNWVGYETSEKYVGIATNRLAQKRLL